MIHAKYSPVMPAPIIITSFLLALKSSLNEKIILLKNNRIPTLEEPIKSVDNTKSITKIARE